MLDLATITTKGAVLLQLSEQSQGGIFLAHGVKKEVYVLTNNVYFLLLEGFFMVNTGLGEFCEHCHGRVHEGLQGGSRGQDPCEDHWSPGG